MDKTLYLYIPEILDKIKYFQKIAISSIIYMYIILNSRQKICRIKKFHQLMRANVKFAKILQVKIFLKFFPHSKDCHRFYVIIRTKNSQDKDFTYESRGQKKANRQKFLHVKISSCTASPLLAMQDVMKLRAGLSTSGCRGDAPPIRLRAAGSSCEHTH